MNHKEAEQVIRLIRRERGPNYVGTHEFTAYSSIFNSNYWTDRPWHVKGLVHHLQNAFKYGIPARDKGSRNGDVLQASDFVVKRLKTHPKIQYAKDAKFGCWKAYQHAKVQQHLHNADPHVLATEVPVWGDDWNGVADDLTLRPDNVIEVGDFKPDIPVTMKKQVPDPTTGIVTVVTQGMIKILSQVARYRAGFVELSYGTRPNFAAVIYDHEAAFEIINDPLCPNPAV